MSTFYTLCSFLLAFALVGFAISLWMGCRQMEALSQACQKAARDCDQLKLHLAQLLADLTYDHLDEYLSDAGLSEAIALAKAQLEVDRAPVPFIARKEFLCSLNELTQR